MEESTFKQMSDKAVQVLLERLDVLCHKHGFDYAFIRRNNIVGFYNENGIDGLYRDSDKEFEEQSDDLTNFFRYFSEDTPLDKTWVKNVGWV